MKVLFILDAMHFGGAAKKITIIANELVKRGNEVFILTDTNRTIGFSISSKINIISLYNNSKRCKIHILDLLNKMRRIRKIVSKYTPNIVISVLPHVSFYTKLSLIGKRIPIIFSDETSFARKDS